MHYHTLAGDIPNVDFIDLGINVLKAFFICNDAS